MQVRATSAVTGPSLRLRGCDESSDHPKGTEDGSRCAGHCTCEDESKAFPSMRSSDDVNVQVSSSHQCILDINQEGCAMNVYSRLRTIANRYPSIKPSLVAARRAMRFAYDPLSGHRDYARIRKKFQHLGTRDELREGFPKDLTLLYNRYVSDVSNYIMAASIELSQFVYSFCDITRPRRIADLGSGFSSVVLRYHQKHRDSDASVWSVDSSEEWLEETRKFLESQGLPSDNLRTWQSMKMDGPDLFDFILYDLGHVRELRKDALDDALNMVAPGGIIVLDDLNFIGYKRYFKQVLKRHDFEKFSLRGFTDDSLGRYSYLLIR